MEKFPKLKVPIAENVLLAPYTTWKIGGEARYLAEPEVDELEDLLKWASNNNIEVHVLGRGSNVLIADGGINGLVVLTRNTMLGLERQGDRIIAEAGVSLIRLSKFAAKQGFSGYEFMVGIPGTLGGAIVMNAGLTVFRPRDMSSLVESIEVMSLDGVKSSISMNDINFKYRNTDLMDGKRILISSVLRLEQSGDPDLIYQNTIQHLHERKRSQPIDKKTAGSIFKTPEGGNGAWWYIDQVGLKGYQIGGAIISNKHANWIENADNATANDVRRLIDAVITRVQAHFGIRLEPEIHYIGSK